MSKGKGNKTAKNTQEPLASKPAEDVSADAGPVADKENVDVNLRPVAPAHVGSSNASGGDEAAKRQMKKRTPFFIFCTDKRSEVREAHPDMPITEQVRARQTTFMLSELPPILVLMPLILLYFTALDLLAATLRCLLPNGMSSRKETSVCWYMCDSLCSPTQAKILGRMWGALSEDEKMKYQQLSASA